MKTDRVLAAEAVQRTMSAARDQGRKEFREIYPVGELVLVRIGRSTFPGEVVDYQEYSGFLRLRVKNCYTGKLRVASVDDLLD